MPGSHDHLEQLAAATQRSLDGNLAAHADKLDAQGTCPNCHKQLPGIWGKRSGHGDGRVRPLV